MKNLTIPTIWTAVDKISPTVVKMSRGIEGMAMRSQIALERNERLFKRFTPALGEAQKQILSMIGTGAAVAGAFQLGNFSFNSIKDYETALRSLQAVTGVSEEKLAVFNEEIQDLAKQSRKSSIDVAKSFETIGSNMSQYLDDPKGLRQITEAGITLSKAARTDLEPTLNDLTSIMNQFGLKAQDAAKSINILTAGEIVGSVRTSQVAGYLQEFGAVAKTMNVDLAESTALIEALGLQMDKSKIGVGARNILTAISAAGGLDKKARKDLKSAGVDVKFLMDNTKSLSDRLHELSKISKDPIKMVSVFGKENLAAGQVIFNQLETYDKFLNRIRTTNEAQTQAATNTKTLSSAIDQLKASWVNMLTGSSNTSEAMNKLKSAIVFVTENLDTLVDIGLKAITFFAVWKGALIAQKVVTMGLTASTVALNAVSNALFLVDMVKYVSVTQGMTKASAALAITQESLSAALAANPIGAIIVGIAALTAGIYLLEKRSEKLRQEQIAALNLRVEDSVKKQRSEVDKLTKSWLDAGYSIRTATIESLKFKRLEAEQALSKAKTERDKAMSEAVKRAEENTWNPFFSFDKNAEEYMSKNEDVTKALAALSENTNLFLRAKESGIVSDKDVMALLTGKKVKTEVPTGTFATPLQPEKPKTVMSEADKKKYEENLKVVNSQMTVTIKNESNSTVDAKLGNMSARNVMPNTTSTLLTIAK